MTLIRFTFLLLAVTLFQVGIVLAIPNIVPVNDTIKAIVFFATITAAIYPIARFGRNHSDPSMFINTAYISIGLRFVMSLCYVVYYKYTHMGYSKAFIISFFISYVFYTIFEITSLTAKLRPNSKEKNSSNESTNI
jgi:hypothetical protein